MASVKRRITNFFGGLSLRSKQVSGDSFRSLFPRSGSFVDTFLANDAHAKCL